MGLNEEQLAAAHHPEGEAALLLAGAGAGKTSTLTERVSWLIEQGVPARKILALTFTNRAAKEILERVEKRLNLPAGAAEPRITTIHSLALSMIRRNPEGFGLAPKVTPLSEYDQLEMFKEIIARMVKEDPSLAEDKSMNPWRIQEMISFHRARGLGFRVDYTEEAHLKALREYSGYHALVPTDLTAWARYEQECRLQNKIDFDAMIHLVVRRGREDAAWRQALQKVFQHVMMDESQDTNKPCWDLVNLLVGPDNRNLCIIGDLNQAIFGFSGATPELIQEFSKSWRGSPPSLYKIVRNHRSVPEIVRLANSLQKKMVEIDEAIPLQMESYRGDVLGQTGKARLIRAMSPREIAIKIAEDIAEARDHSPDFQFRDYCILVRSSMQVRDVEGELVRSRIPYIVRGGRGLLQTEEVQDVLAYMRLATNPCDFSALKRASSVPKRGVGEVALEKIRVRAIAEFGGNLLKSAMKEPKLYAFVDMLNVMSQHTSDPVHALDTAIRRCNYHEYLKAKYKSEPDRMTTKLENLGRLRELVESLAEDSEMTTEDLIFQLTLDKGDQDDGKGKVTISTIHAAKGLEWHTVWLTNVVEGSLPHKWSIQSGNLSEIGEERRLLYVALTRAKNIVNVCVPLQVVLRTDRVNGQNKLIYGEVDPSRFLVELGVVPDKRG